MGSIIRFSGRVFYSLLYLNSRRGFYELKCVYSVISVIVDSLPGDSKNRESIQYCTLIPSLGEGRGGLHGEIFRTTYEICQNNSPKYTERFSVLYTKYVKITAPNMGNTPNGVQTAGGGFQVGTATLSRATRIVKFFVPGKKFTRSGILQYYYVP